MKYKVGQKLKNDGDIVEILSVGSRYYHTLDEDGHIYHWTDAELEDEGFILHDDRPDLKVDDKVLVRNYETHGWAERHFAGWGEDGQIECWASGKTSWSTDDKNIWLLYKLPESED